MPKKIRLSIPDRIFMFCVYFFLFLAMLLVIYPLIFIISASFSEPSNVLTGKVWLLPVDFSLFSYQAVFKNKQILSGYFNSAWYTVVGTAISVALTIMAAFPLSRKGFYGKNVFMGLFLFTMLFSGGLIPTYLLLKNIGMINTRWAIVIPNAIAVWLVIIARTFFQQNVPEELYEAAEIDGCDDFRFLIKMVLPLSGPIVAVIALNYAVWIWNGYYDALIYLTDQKKYPLQIILRDILILNRVDINTVSDLESSMRKQGLAVVLKYSLIVVASAPLLVVYPFLQKYFVKGILIGSVKG